MFILAEEKIIKLLSEKYFFLRKIKQQLFNEVPLDQDIYLHLCNSQKYFARPTLKKCKTIKKIQIVC